MSQEHVWSRIAHDDSDLFLHRSIVAVDRTVLTGGFSQTIGTVSQSIQGIGVQLMAIAADPIGEGMMRPAIESNHRVDGAGFTTQSSCEIVHSARMNSFSLLVSSLPRVLTPEQTSTPYGLTRCTASVTFSGSKPPARNTGLLHSATIRALISQL